MRQRLETIVFGSLITCGLCACTPGPMDPEPYPQGEPAAAGLPGEPVDPAFEHVEMPYDGNQDPGPDLPMIDP